MNYDATKHAGGATVSHLGTFAGAGNLCSGHPRRMADLCRIGATLALLAVTLIACTPRSEIRTGADGFRTFTVIREIDGHPVVCPAFGIVPHGVQGTLRGEAGVRDPVWLETEDGHRLSVVWPEGFTVRFEPDAVLYNEKGYAMRSAGDLTELAQVSPGDALGTFEDPYIASGILFGTCYPYLH